MTKEALKLSQEALAGLKDVEKQVRELVAENKALKEALAQPEQDSTYTYASSLATAIWQKHYMKESPKWKPLDTTEGVLTQIDNMTCGLIKEKPAQPEQEPFCLHWEDRWGCNHYADPKEPHPVNAKPLYTHPPQRTWVDLTEEQMMDCDIDEDGLVTSRVWAKLNVQAKLKEKNT